MKRLLLGDNLLHAIESYGVVILVGQTGSGKTTRTPFGLNPSPDPYIIQFFPELPQFLYESGWAKEGNIIACTQPRRVAATSVAHRVAAEVGTTLGDEVSLCSANVKKGILPCLRTHRLATQFALRMSVIKNVRDFSI